MRRQAKNHGGPAAENGSDILVENISKSFGSGPPAVADVSFTLRKGEFLTLLGPSGSGKTTTLLMIAGFEQPTAGDVKIAGRSIVGVGPERRNLGIVFQQYSLFPHMSVRENVEYPLRMRRVSKQERAEEADRALELVGLGRYADRQPMELSGGQQQRVAIARALVFRPDALLLDEPLAALDRRLREQLQGELKAIQRELGVSVLLITHDQEEAMRLSDRIGVMDEGRLLQLGTPDEVYHRPATRFVARFVGDTNMLECEAGEADGPTRSLSLRDGGRARVPAAAADGLAPGSRATISIRPEKLRFVTGEDPGANALGGIVADRTFLGPSLHFAVEVGDRRLILTRPDRGDLADLPAPGDRVLVGWDEEDAIVLREEPSDARGSGT